MEKQKEEGRAKRWMPVTGCGGFTILELLVVIAIIVTLAALIIPAVMYALTLAQDARDLANVRGMAAPLGLYYKKHAKYPAMVDATKATSIKDVRAGGHCVSLKYLMMENWVEDASVFFSPRTGGPDQDTLDKILVDTNPAVDPVWACSYAYDPGHVSSHGGTVLYGTNKTWLMQNPGREGYFLSADLNVMTMSSDAGTYTIKNRKPGETKTTLDNIYEPEETVFGWKDAYLNWDVPERIDPAAPGGTPPAP